jgi:hypothetical protein
VTRQEVSDVILDGFFPRVPLESRPAGARSGFQEFGLPYAPDAAISKYLAAFLTTHRHAGDQPGEVVPHDPARPDLLLFNGGVFESNAIRERIIDQLHAWFRRDDPTWSITVLDNERLDLAVARGAAYYGLVRRGEGVRIAAGLARTYYVGVEGTDGPQALCLCPAGLEPGEEVDLTSRTFALRLAEPIELPLYVSSTRLTDRPGDVLPVEREQLTGLPPIRTVFKAGKPLSDQATVTVSLHARLTEIGTLDLWCRELDGKRSWKLLFDVRAATRTDVVAREATANQQGVIDETWRARADELIAATFRPQGADPATLMHRLSEALELSRLDWPPTLLRQLWETLLDAEPGRRISASHEARWLNLTGFALRPGYGVAVDDWRVAETWKRLNGKIAHAQGSVRVEWWILWRRLAGGLTPGQQQALATPLLGSLREAVRALKKPRGAAASAHELAEQCRLLGALEWLPPTLKETLGELLFEIAASPAPESLRAAAVWSLGRVGARQPSYGPLNTCVSPEVIAGWLPRLWNLPGENPFEVFALTQLARKTGDRYRDVEPAMRDQVLAELTRQGATGHQLELVREGGTLDGGEQGAVFGEALPKGLRIL